MASAIDSVTWNGLEFIDSFDHGRQLQSAAFFDAAAPGPFWAEAYNPTEAGSRRDGIGQTSSSRLLALTAGGAELRSRTEMAFWLAPGEDSAGHPAKNNAIRSRHIVSKSVRIGLPDLPHAIDYRVTFTVPEGERYTFAQFEALTGYMPETFDTFWRFNPAANKLAPLDDVPGEQSLPEVTALTTGTHAMGVYSPDQPSRGFEQVGYGRFRFPAEKVTKWNCIFRVRAPNGLAPGDYPFRVFVAVGTLEDVRRTLHALYRKFAPP